ncbi:hypothetical protein DI005_04825 [Prauserella sp. PE36]|uniref:hypothetical protein n=1 Tax=Prauserella sp. PE36 TaxID=1504709 RepID=UPI000D9A760B|nr:hypothetical protein [Prauserella sp. PE36]PXY17113.1 hypothetical protein BAY59_36690 [Prauserella coralliicola]RBM22773.1 hypothetical protein DI005_04825 [Prauserella sp. PE36]
MLRRTVKFRADPDAGLLSAELLDEDGNLLQARVLDARDAALLGEWLEAEADEAVANGSRWVRSRAWHHLFPTDPSE